MNPYLFTITFLMMMSLLTSSEAIRFAQGTIEKKCYIDSRELSVATEELREFSHLEELRHAANPTPKPKKKRNILEKSEKYNRRARALGVNAARPPNNARLNLYTLLHKKPSNDLPKEFSLYEVVAELIRSLYSDDTFFKDNPGVEYLILDKLMEKKEESKNFTTPDQLGGLDFEDDRLQAIFYQMLKGTKNSPSLLNYITFDNIKSGHDRKINLLFVAPIVMHAIFPQGHIAEQLLAGRDQIWAEIAYQEAQRLELNKEKCKGRRDFSEKLTEALEAVLTSVDLKSAKYKSQVFDCTLSEAGTVIFLEDPTTGALIREKYVPSTKPPQKK